MGNASKLHTIWFDLMMMTQRPLLIPFTKTLSLTIITRDERSNGSVRTITHFPTKTINKYLMEKQTNQTKLKKKKQQQSYTDKTIFVSRNAIHWIWMYSDELIRYWFDFHSYLCVHMYRNCTYIVCSIDLEWHRLLNQADTFQGMFHHVQPFTLVSFLFTYFY